MYTGNGHSFSIPASITANGAFSLTGWAYKEYEISTESFQCLQIFNMTAPDR